MRKVKRTAWITVILSLFPLMLGMYYYQNLPNKMATHFNLKGVANGYLNKGPQTLTLNLVIYYG